MPKKVGTLDLLKAARGRKKALPTIANDAFTRVEKERMAQGKCIVCGQQPAGEDSFRCPSCEAADSMEAITQEVAALRRRLMQTNLPDKGE